MPTPDLFVFDVDGTIAPTNGMIDPAIAEALLALHAQTPVVLSTGRSLGGLAPILELLPLPGPHVVSNGAAMVTNGQTSHVYNALSTEDVTTIATYLDSRGFLTVYCLADGNLQVAQDDPRMVDVVEAGAWAPIIGPYQGKVPVLKILTLCFPEEEDDIRTVCAETTEVHRTQFNMIEWTAPGGNKGVALDHQLEALGLTNPMIVAVGDSENDLPLLAKASYKVAMGDGAPEVLAIADEVITEPLDQWIRRQIR